MLLNHARQESGHVEIHHHKMTKASPHYEQMEDFVAAEAGMSSVECCGPERIDNSTHCVDHASCKQPAEGGFRQHGQKPGEAYYYQPAHRYIYDG